MINEKRLEKTVNKIKKLTAENKHTEAIVALAQYLNNGETFHALIGTNRCLLDLAQCLLEEHKRQGHVTLHISNMRENLYNVLMQRIQTVHERTQLEKGF